METIDTIRWYADKNVMSTCLVDYYVEFEICQKDNGLFFPLKVYSDSKELASFPFYSFEDAVSFTQNIIIKCKNVPEMVEQYQVIYGNKDTKFDSIEGNKISLTPDEVDQAIVEYFGGDKKYPVSCKEELTMDQNGVDLVFYLIEHTRIDGVRRDYTVRLTKGDLMNALGAYIGFYGYELDDFKYIDGGHHVGYFTEEDSPRYAGIELEVHKKEKSLEKRNKRRGIDG